MPEIYTEVLFDEIDLSAPPKRIHVKPKTKFEMKKNKIELELSPNQITILKSVLQKVLTKERDDIRSLHNDPEVKPEHKEIFTQAAKKMIGDIENLLKQVKKQLACGEQSKLF